MSRVLILCPDHIGENMAGPGIRYTEMARALAVRHNVTLGTIEPTDYKVAGVSLKYYDEANILALINDNDVVLISGFHANRYRLLHEVDRAIVVDIYDPFVLENLELASRRGEYDFETSVQNDILRLGDFFICASERQRDFWLGMFAALHRLEPAAYLRDKTMRELVDVVSFGIPIERPARNKDVLKGVYPGIGPDDKVILWGGGLYDWLDPQTLIKAMAEVNKSRQDIKLFFMGTKHPNPNVPSMAVVDESIALAKELGLYDSTVFFNDWVPYAERGDYLLEADLGASLHCDHLETRFSFRTRVLDYIWAGLPVLATEGDAMADIVNANGIGVTVGYQSVHETAEAVLHMFEDPTAIAACRNAFGPVQDRFRWERVIEPLARFCDSPTHRQMDVVGAAEAEDLRATVTHLDKLVTDKDIHITNLENVIRAQDVFLKEFPGNWLNVITRAYRRIFKRRPGGTRGAV